MKFSVEMTVTDGGTITKKNGYLRDSKIELLELLEYTREALILNADRVLKEEQAKGFDKQPLVVVDNRPRKPVQSVSPLGQIEFISRQNVTAIVLEAYTAILYRSKVLTGRYKSSHFVFLNGIQVATDEPSLKAWIATNPQFKEKDLIRIVNIQPYARKLERYGVTAQRSKPRGEKNKKRPESKPVLVPNGTYFLTARAIRSKYKRNSIIRFTFLPGSSLGISGSFKGGRAGKNSAGRPYLYPSLTISVQERGTV